MLLDDPADTDLQPARTFADYAQRARSPRTGSPAGHVAAALAQLTTPSLSGAKLTTSPDARGRLFTTPLDPRVISEIAERSRTERVTPFIAWLDALAQIVWRDNPRGFVVTVPVADRPHPGDEDIIGCCTWIAFLIIGQDPNLPPPQRRNHLAAVVEDALRAGPLPIDDIIAAVSPHERTKVLQAPRIALSYHSGPEPSYSGDRVDITITHVDSGLADMPLTVHVWPYTDSTPSLGVIASDAMCASAVPHRLAADLAAKFAERHSDLSPQPPSLHEPHELTPTQFLIWLDQTMDPASARYNVAVAHQLTVDIDDDLLAEAVAATVARTDALRVSVVDTAHGPRMIPDSTTPAHAQLRFADSTELWSRVHQEAQQPFTFDQPLFRSLLLLSDTEVVWMITAHHIICDGVSVQVIFDRVRDLYERLRTNGDLPDDYPSFLNAATRIRELASSERGRRDRTFWERRRATFTPAVPRRVSSTGSTRHSFDLGADLTRRLKGCAPTPVELLGWLSLAVARWWALLNDVTHVGLGTPLHGRRTREDHRCVGLFMGIFPFEVDTALELSESLDGVRDSLYQVLRHSTHTIADPVGQRSFDVLVNLQTIAAATFADRPTHTTWVPSGAASEPVEVQFNDFQGSGSLHVQIDLRDDLLRTVPTSELTGLLAATVAALTATGSSDAITADAARIHGLLLGHRVDAATLWLPEAVWRHSESDPQRAAVVSEDEVMTYEQLCLRASALADQLTAVGVGRADRVVIRLARGHDLIAACLAVMAVRATTVIIDPDQGEARNNLVTVAVGPAAIITADDLSAAVPVIHPSTPAKAAAPLRLPTRPHGSELAYICFTSGSTGTPKGCAISWSAIENYICGWQTEFPDAAGARLQLASATADVFYADMFRALIPGDSLVVSPLNTTLDPGRLLDLIRTSQVAAAEFVPATLRPLVKHVTDTHQQLPPSLHTIEVGSDMWRVHDHRALERVTHPDTTRLNTYGLSECAVTSTLADAAGDSDTQHAPIGRPFPGQEVYVLDRQLRRAPIGVTGEIYIGGTALARGYWDQPGLTASRFIANPWSPAPGARMYRTGDLAYVGADGWIRLNGRSDDQIKVAGLRIEAGDVVTHLESHLGVAEAAVTVANDRLHAYIVPAGELSVQSLSDHLAQRLPQPARPAQYFTVDQVPRTATGKPDRDELAKAATPLAGAVWTNTATLTPTERVVHDIWARLIGVTGLDTTQSFFDIGGTSLLLVRACAELNDAFRAELTVADLFENPTIASLSRLLDAGATTTRRDQPPVRPAARLLEQRRLRQSLPLKDDRSNHDI